MSLSHNIPGYCPPEYPCAPGISNITWADPLANWIGEPFVMPVLNSTPAPPATAATQTQAPAPAQLIAGIDNSTLLLGAGGIIAALVILKG